MKIWINMAMSLDGKSVLADGRWHSLTSLTDRDNMDRLRAKADVILVGAESLRQDNAKLFVRNQPNRKKHPLPVVFTASGEIDPTWNLFSPPHPKPIFVGSLSAEMNLHKKISDKDFIFFPWDGWQELPRLINWLTKNFNAKIILLEGGPEVNCQFIKLNLITDFFLTIVPFVIGSGRGPVDCNRQTTDFSFMQPFLQKAEKVQSRKQGNEIFLHYQFRS